MLRKFCVYVLLIVSIVTTTSFLHCYNGELAFKKLTILTRALNATHVPWEHYGVMRSLKAGLDKLGIPYNYNPSCYADVGDVVLVPCSKAALYDALDMKKRGIIKKLFVGPNFYPKDANFEDIDIFLVPSEPFIKFFQDMGSKIYSHCRVCYAGVDPDFWVQDTLNYLQQKNVLVYWKTEPIGFCENVERILKSYGWNPKRIRYGSYKLKEYKELLQNCRFAVFISVSESQGLALAECWAMDVPTFPWNPMSLDVFGHHFDYISSCPYLNAQVGQDWNSLDDLKNILQKIDFLLPTFSPRKWVLDNMTDEVAAVKLIEVINNELMRND